MVFEPYLNHNFRGPFGIGLSLSSLRIVLAEFSKPACPSSASFHADWAIRFQFAKQSFDHLAVQRREHLLKFRHGASPGRTDADVLQKNGFVLFAVQPLPPGVNAGLAG